MAARVFYQARKESNRNLHGTPERPQSTVTIPEPLNLREGTQEPQPTKEDQGGNPRQQNTHSPRLIAHCFADGSEALLWHAKKVWGDFLVHNQQLHLLPAHMSKSISSMVASSHCAVATCRAYSFKSGCYFGVGSKQSSSQSVKVHGVEGPSQPAHTRGPVECRGPPRNCLGTWNACKSGAKGELLRSQEPGAYSTHAIPKNFALVLGLTGGALIPCRRQRSGKLVAERSNPLCTVALMRKEP